MPHIKTVVKIPAVRKVPSACTDVTPRRR